MTAVLPALQRQETFLSALEGLKKFLDHRQVDMERELCVSSLKKLVLFLIMCPCVSYMWCARTSVCVCVCFGLKVQNKVSNPLGLELQPVWASLCGCCNWTCSAGAVRALKCSAISPAPVTSLLQVYSQVRNRNSRVAAPVTTWLSAQGLTP